MLYIIYENCGKLNVRLKLYLLVMLSIVCVLCAGLQLINDYVCFIIYKPMNNI